MESVVVVATQVMIDVAGAKVLVKVLAMAVMALVVVGGWAVQVAVEEVLSAAGGLMVVATRVMVIAVGVKALVT